MKYRKERGEERTARATTRIDPPHEHGGKLRAFAASIYSDEEVAMMMDELWEQEQQRIDETKQDISDEQKRKVGLVL